MAIPALIPSGKTFQKVGILYPTKDAINSAFEHDIDATMNQGWKDKKKEFFMAFKKYGAGYYMFTGPRAWQPVFPDMPGFVNFEVDPNPKK